MDVTSPIRIRQKERDRDVETRLMKELGVPRLVASVLVQRGYAEPADADKFLNPRLEDLGDPTKIAKSTKEYEDRFLSPFVAAERGYIDEVIQPYVTRRRIARALSMLRHKQLENPWKKHDNIPL